MELKVGNVYTLRNAVHLDNEGRQVKLVKLDKESYRITAYIISVESGKPLTTASLFDGLSTTDAMNLYPAVVQNCRSNCCKCCRHSCC